MIPPENYPRLSLQNMLVTRAKAKAHALTVVLVMPRMAGLILGRVHALILGRVHALILGAELVLRVPHCVGPSLFQSLNLPKVCASTRLSLPRAIVRAVTQTSLFLRAACALTANQNQTRRGAYCHVKVLWSMGAFCRPLRLLPILCSTSPCR